MKEKRRKPKEENRNSCLALDLGGYGSGMERKQHAFLSFQSIRGISIYTSVVTVIKTESREWLKWSHLLERIGPMHRLVKVDYLDPLTIIYNFNA